MEMDISNEPMALNSHNNSPRAPAYGQAYPEAPAGSTAFIHEGGAEPMRHR